MLCLLLTFEKIKKNQRNKMSETLGSDVVVSLRVELDEEIKRSIRNLSYQRHGSSSKLSATTTVRSSQRHQSRSEAGAGGDGHDDDDDDDEDDDDDDAEYALQWSAIQRLPTFKRLRSALLTVDVHEDDGGSGGGGDGGGGGCRFHEVIDVTKLGYLRRRLLIRRLIKHIPTDNHLLLRNIKNRINRVGVQWPTIEVRYKNLRVEAECEIFHGKPIPTLWNSITSTISSLTSILGVRADKAKMTILNDVSGIIKPGRLTLLLGPPGCGKTSLLKALSGNLNQSVKGTGEVTYNGYKLEEFVPQKTSAYISQNDLHFPEMTVKETIDFAARCHGAGFRSEIVTEVSRREKEAGIIPDFDIDAYMKAIATEGQETSLQTDYILKILGLESCSESQVGDALRGGVSGGQKRRLTTGEMTVGPKRALFMDQITDGLDGSTSFQVVACLQQLVHVTNATVLVSLLQSAPETFDLFDDVVLMSEGRIVYHGPCNQILDFFEDCGFKCPNRKMTADFVEEVLSRKEQAQYWYHDEVPYNYVSVQMFHRKFMESYLGKNLCKDLSVPYDKSRSHPNAISFSTYSVSKWQLFKACMSRELTIVKRNSSLYVFKTFQLITLGVITMTVFLRTQMKIDIFGATYHMGSLFFSLITLLVDGFPETSMTVARLPVFHKQRAMCFYPAWAYAISNCLIKIPLSFWQALVWTCLTYYVIGYTPEVQRFFRQFLTFFGMHLASSSLFRFLGSVFQTSVLSMATGVYTMLLMLLFGGFIITHPSMQAWLKWAFWISPMTYAEIGLSLNEFLAPRWQKMISDNTTIGREALGSRGLFFNGYMYWVSVVALFGFTALFNIAFAVALTFVKPSGLFHSPISLKNLAEKEGSQDGIDAANKEEKSGNAPSNMGNRKVRNRVALPFTPFALAFEDVQYYIDTPLAMKKQEFPHNRLQLLSNITGTLQPGVLTALMGVSGAGKTTLLDVLSGRKTSGYIEGQIKVGGYLKSQKTFTRMLGYCEQNDVHSPQITIEESLLFSAWLRLPPEIDSETKAEFVNEVLEAIELEGIKDSLVGSPGINGLSPEQRKRLTIAVELVANPSIIFMDEPTTGLDARAAGIVMRAVKNVAETGRTILCTIHQPRIDIFESFDELILLKKGGNIIYHGPLGQNSNCVIEYFEAIPGVPKIRNNYNPAIWMLEVTSPAVEGELGIDFAQIYKDSALYADNKALVKELSIPPSGSEELRFPTQFPQNSWVQFKCCLWKQHLSYWRSPSYNLTRILFTLMISLLFGVVFCNHAKGIKNQQDLLIILGSMYSIILYLGIYTCSTTLPHVAAERTVMNRERFAGMYSSWSYPLAQVAIEVPYLLIQAIMVLAVTYPLIGYSWSAYKVLFYLHAMFCSLLIFKCLGMLLVSITPNVTVAAILVSACFPLFNLFSGYLIPRPNIPKWWIWPYYIVPSSWLLNGLLSSQFGDVEKDIVAFGETKTIANFLNDYFGYHQDFLPVVAVVLFLYPLALAFLFGFFMGRLKFNKR